MLITVTAITIETPRMPQNPFFLSLIASFFVV
jgi:hypothetical protein